jgi:proliferating cell nuclear antigen
MTEEDQEHVLLIKTVQSVAFKTLTDALKELVTDTNIEIGPQGIKILEFCENRVVLVHLFLDATKFEHYYCPSTTIIGVNMLNFYKLIKTINSSDTLTLLMHKDDINHLGIRIENSAKNSRTTFKLQLMELDRFDISVPPTQFNTVIVMPSLDFQKICRDMKNVGDNVDIKNIGQQLFFSCEGEFCCQETILSDAPDSGGGGITHQVSDDTEIVQGVFQLKYLVQFTRCTNLCNQVELYLKNDYALIVRYTIASLGEIKLCLAPQSDDTFDEPDFNI